MNPSTLSPSECLADATTPFRVVLAEEGSIGQAPGKKFSGDCTSYANLKYMARFFPDLGLLYIFCTWEAEGVRLKADPKLYLEEAQIPYKRLFVSPCTYGEAVRLAVATQPVWIAEFQAAFAEHADGFETPDQVDERVRRLQQASREARAAQTSKNEG